MICCIENVTFALLRNILRVFFSSSCPACEWKMLDDLWKEESYFSRFVSDERFLFSSAVSSSSSSPSFCSSFLFSSLNRCFTRLTRHRQRKGVTFSFLFSPCVTLLLVCKLHLTRSSQCFLVSSVTFTRFVEQITSFSVSVSVEGSQKQQQSSFLFIQASACAVWWGDSRHSCCSPLFAQHVQGERSWKETFIVSLALEYGDTRKVRHWKGKAERRRRKKEKKRQKRNTVIKVIPEVLKLIWCVFRESSNFPLAVIKAIKRGEWQCSYER